MPCSASSAKSVADLVQPRHMPHRRHAADVLAVVVAVGDQHQRAAGGVGGLGVVARVAHHPGGRRGCAERLAGLQQRQRVGLLAREVVAAEHMPEVAGQPLALEQLARRCGGLVGQHRQRQAPCAQGLQPLDDTRVDGRVRAVHGGVVGLVERPGVVEQAGSGPDMGERLPHQVLAAAADGVLDEAAAHGRQTEVGQRQPEHGHEVAQGVDQGAVEVEDDGLRVRHLSTPSALNIALMPRTAWRMRLSFSISAKRTWPSPWSPKPMPGDTQTLAFSSSCRANSSEPSSR
mmetsp:Transcript_2838/g.7331  ORF Transcript_2838/g.7331 Transcript_2838/m.7331 type:complete len:289 (+) Transcript_2838:212-1078(+)